MRLLERCESVPTPRTQELLRVVVSEAVGAPELALVPPVAPMAPEPPEPEVSTPLKVTTVMVAAVEVCDRLARTVTFDSVLAENARQISAVPCCVLVRRTSDHVRLPPRHAGYGNTRARSIGGDQGQQQFVRLRGAQGRRSDARDNEGSVGGNCLVDR